MVELQRSMLGFARAHFPAFLRGGRFHACTGRCWPIGLVMLGVLVAFLSSLTPPGAGVFVTPSAAAATKVNARAKVGGSAPPQSHCLSRQEQRARIAARAAIPLGKAIRAVKGRGDLLRARLCEREGRLLYLLTLLGRSGKVLRVAVDAKTGMPVGGQH